ncbi:MAG: tetratricopeptide repeat protein [Planctomycetota bacterium]
MVTNLGACCLSTGRVDEAIQLFERTCEAKPRVLGMGHPWTASAFRLLDAAYRTAGRVDDAEALAVRRFELECDEALAGEDWRRADGLRRSCSSAAARTALRRREPCCSRGAPRNWRSRCAWSRVRPWRGAVRDGRRRGAIAAAEALLEAIGADGSEELRGRVARDLEVFRAAPGRGDDR